VVKRVDRYLWRELLPPFGVALLAFLVFIGLELVLSLSDTLFARGAQAGELLRLFLYKLPSLLTLAIPAGVLLATFLALSRLASARELLAFQALGYPLGRLLVPFVAFGLVASMASFLLSELAVPPAEAAYRRELLAILYQGEVPRPEEDLFFRGSQGELYYLSRYQGEKAWGIVVYDLEGKLFGEPGPFPALVTASEGRFASGELVLSAGRLLRFSPDGGLEEVLRFESLTLQVGEDIQQGILGGKTPGEMSVRELLARIRLFERSGLDPRNLVVELHSKLAIAAAALVFALFGAPLGALLGRRGRAAGAVAGFLLAAGAQGLFIWTRTLARRGFLPASLGGWLPHLVLGTLGLVLLLSVDRLRLKRLWLGFFLLGIGLGGLGAPPPFQWLEAQELVILGEAEGFLAQGVAAELGGYRLAAGELAAHWGGARWEVEVQGAELSGQGLHLVAQALEMELGPEGELVRLTARDFSGSSRFQGPEREETLVFTGRWGEASFQAGELERLSGEGVEFTTCPCLAEAPYAVEAGRFVLLPERWLYAEDVWITAFEQPVAWLPVYAARLGEEASPLFPEIGRQGGHWYLRWHFPFTLGEGMWGAVGLTWFPGLGLAQPSLRFLWEDGKLDLAEGRGSLSAQGEWPPGPWRARLSWRENRLDLSLSGSLADTNWTLSWGQATRDELSYQKLPELSLSRGGLPWWGGTLSWNLRWGNYREAGRAGWRAGVTLNWQNQLTFGPWRITLPWQLSLDQYQGSDRVLASFSPGMSAGGLSLTYLRRWRWGSSPWEFDRLPPQHRLAATLTASQAQVRQELRLGWDLATGHPLPGRWQLTLPGLELTGEFSLVPARITRLSGVGKLEGDWGRLTLQGGIRFQPLGWEDFLLRGRFQGEGWSATLGARFSPWPLRVKRLAGSLRLALGQDWSLRGAGEFDFPSGRFLQLRAGLWRSFAGCLEAGVELYLGGIRVSFQVPAFPHARFSFSPLDEGLRLGG